MDGLGVAEGLAMIAGVIAGFVMWVLKLFGVLNMHWVAVLFAPVWVPIVLALAMVVGAVLISVALAIHDAVTS